jgi:predicted PurR-regulated permease PerM
MIDPSEPVPIVAPAPPSPRWSTATKFLVALVIVVIVGALLVRFQEMIPPLVLAVILAYLLNPVAGWLVARTRLSWGAAVAVSYLALVLVLVTLLTVAGIALEQQIEGLYRQIVVILPDLPTQLENLLDQPVKLGPFTIDLSKDISIGPIRIPLSTIDLRPLFNQLLNAIQPLLSRTGTLVGSLASGTASVLGWMLFILIISYYLLHDLRNLVPSIEQIVPAGYAYDVRRLLAELGPIWNAFLRGQITLSLAMGVLVAVTMALLGVRYALVLGLLAGLLEFLPIIGPLIAGLVAVLVALFQPENWMGINPLYFALVVAAVQILLSQIENNFLVPRIIGGSLNLHPVVILVGAIIAANLAGIIGLLLSAPIIASLRLFGRYIYRKMFDLNPWPDPPAMPVSLRRAEWPRWLRLRSRRSELGSQKSNKPGY